MDPYCSYRSGPNRIKGPICRNGGKFPKWEDATVIVPAGNEPSMLVDLMDKEKILFDNTIGSFVIDLYEIQQVGQLSKWYPVYYKQKPAGEILMEAAFQPIIAPQPETVVVKQTVVEQPVIVKEVIREEIVQKPVEVVETVHVQPVQHVQHVHNVQHTQQEFRSGPIINGISHIHHGGEGHGLGGQQGIITQGTTLQQGSYMPQGYGQGVHTEGGFAEHHLPHDYIQQGIHTHGKHHNTGLTQGGLNQGSYTQGGLNQGNVQPNQF